MSAAVWSTRDELLYWLQFVGMCVLFGVVVVARFAFAVAFRVLDIALWLAGVVAVLAIVLHAAGVL